MKKILLGLGTLVSKIAPVAAVVACGTNKDGSISLTQEESSLALELAQPILGISDTDLAFKDEFTININSLSESGIDLSITRTHKGSNVTAGAIQLSNIGSSSSTPISMAPGEKLNIQLTLNAAKDAIATTKISLSGSKTVDKNGILVFIGEKTPSVNLLKDTIQRMVKFFKGQSKTIKLTHDQLLLINNSMGVSTVSAESIFGGTLDSAKPTETLLTGETKGQKFDLNFKIVAESSISISDKDGNIESVTSGKTIDVHLAGIITNAFNHSVGKLTTHTASYNGKTIELDETGSKTLGNKLLDIFLNESHILSVANSHDFIYGGTGFHYSLGFGDYARTYTGEWQANVHSITSTSIDFSITRIHKSSEGTVSEVGFTNQAISLQSDPTNHVDIEIGETIHFNLVLNSSKDDLATFKVSLSDSKISSKNQNLLFWGNSPKDNIQYIKESLEKAFEKFQTYK